MAGPSKSPLTHTVDTSAHPVEDRVAAAQAGPADSNHRDWLAHTSEQPAGDLNSADYDHDGRSTPMPADPLATLIEQLQENWHHDNHAANDELVMRIREHIRRQQAAARPHPNRDDAAEDVQRPSGAGVTSSPPTVDFPPRVR
ncbi:MAG: hypothetical protein LC808_18900 [Actinobacteria bacterium]|nr:hypothetical protein [Actinomycetota bacterium]